MEEKRLQVIESAIGFFSEKGYFYTSMEDIAKDCGISKGSLYKLFNSKEELLIQLFEFNHEKMMQRAKTLPFDGSLTEKEILKKLIVVELEGALENKDFFNIIYKSLPEAIHQKTFVLLKKIRTEMVNLHKHILLRIYGEKVKNGIWDLVITFQGVIKEFIFLINREEKQVDFEQVASYIADFLEAAIEYLPERKPVLTDQLMNDYETAGLTNDPLTWDEKRIAASSWIKTRIKEADFEREKKEQFLSSLEMLDEELKKSDPRPFLIAALLAYLKEAPEIKKAVIQLEALL